MIALVHPWAVWLGVGMLVGGLAGYLVYLMGWEAVRFLIVLLAVIVFVAAAVALISWGQCGALFVDCS